MRPSLRVANTTPSSASPRPPSQRLARGAAGSAEAEPTALTFISPLPAGELPPDAFDIDPQKDFTLTWTSHTLLIWAAFILTLPLGAALGDFFDKPHDHGDLALSRYAAWALLDEAIVVLTLAFKQRAALIAR